MRNLYSIYYEDLYKNLNYSNNEKNSQEETVWYVRLVALICGTVAIIKKCTPVTHRREV